MPWDSCKMFLRGHRHQTAAASCVETFSMGCLSISGSLKTVWGNVAERSLVCNKNV